MGGAASPKLDIRVLGFADSPAPLPCLVRKGAMMGTTAVGTLPLRRSPGGAGRWDRVRVTHDRRRKFRQTLYLRVPLR